MVFRFFSCSEVEALHFWLLLYKLILPRGFYTGCDAKYVFILLLLYILETSHDRNDDLNGDIID